MQRLLISFLFIAIAQISFAQTPVSSANDSIVFENLSHNFGVLPYGSVAHCEYKFTNKGSKPLVLEQVHPLCECTEAIAPTAPIAPGDSGVISITYNTTLVGKFSKAITVNSNASNSFVILVVEGEVLPKE